MNLQESIRRILKEESDSGKYLKAVKVIVDDFKNRDFVCDIDVTYYAEYYNVKVIIDNKNLETNFEKESLWYAEGLIKRYLSDLRDDIRSEILDLLPVKVLISFRGIPHCGWEPLNESEGKKGKYITMIEDLTEEFKNEDCVCDIKIEYKPDEEIYLINVILGNLDMDDKFNGVNWRERDYRGKLKMKISKEVFEVLPIAFFVEFKQTPKCKDYKNLKESENKKSSLLSNIEENGLYEVISSTGLHINEIEQKVGQLSREVLEEFIKDVVKEHFQVIDDGQTYIIYLEDYPFDAVPIGNSDYVDQLRVVNNKLFFLVTLYEEDEYGDLEEQSYEIVSPKNLLYMNIYEIAGQLGFLLSKGQI